MKFKHSTLWQFETACVPKAKVMNIRSKQKQDLKVSHFFLGILSIYTQLQSHEDKVKLQVE